jgi:hypothetical protein
MPILLVVQTTQNLIGVVSIHVIRHLMPKDQHQLHSKCKESVSSGENDARRDRSINIFLARPYRSERSPRAVFGSDLLRITGSLIAVQPAMNGQ